METKRLILFGDDSWLVVDSSTLQIVRAGLGWQEDKNIYETLGISPKYGFLALPQSQASTLINGLALEREKESSPVQ